MTLLSGGEKIGPWFNVNSKAAVSGPLTFIGGALYLSDVSGQVSKVKLDRTGAVMWKFMIGEALSAPPMVVDRRFFAANEVGELYCADDETGFQVWSKPAPRVKSILAGSKERLYCRSLTDKLLVIDTKSGSILSESSAGVIGQDIINQLDDRLYLMSAGGTVQCARQAGKEFVMPTFHEEQPAATPEAEKPATSTEPASEMPAEGQPEADPFGAGTAEPMAPAGDAADPFAVPGGDGAAANPF